jgi:hypothetical protein
VILYRPCGTFTRYEYPTLAAWVVIFCSMLTALAWRARLLGSTKAVRLAAWEVEPAGIVWSILTLVIERVIW